MIRFEHIFEVIAGLIIEGIYKFTSVKKSFRNGVAKKLKEKGYEHLATDSEAKEDEEK